MRALWFCEGASSFLVMVDILFQVGVVRSVCGFGDRYHCFSGLESSIRVLMIYGRLVRAREATRSYPLGRAREIRVLP